MPMPTNAAALADHIGRIKWDAAKLARHQENRLRALLRQARSSSPFHTERLRDIDIDRLTLADLPALPIMTKSDMMENLDRIVTDRRLSRTAIEAHLDHTGDDASMLFDEYVAVLSGGSSGRRGVFVYSREAATHYLLALFRRILPRLLTSRRRPGSGVQMAVVAAGSGRHTSRALPSLFGGTLLDTASIPVTQPLPSIVTELQRLQPAVLLGYPSMLRLLAQEQNAGRLGIAPVAVISCSEQLTGPARQQIDGAFGVGVYDQFASTEGLIGLSEANDPDIVLASDLAIVELVDEHDRPVAPGVPCASVLVTNLFNPVQPLIRYRMGDCFIRQPESGTCGHLRVKIEGRTDHMLLYGELAVHPVAIRSELIATPAISEYQIRQTATGVHVDLVAAGSIDLSDLCNRLRSALQTAGLHAPSATAEVKPRLVRDAATGKLRLFIGLEQSRPSLQAHTH